MRRDQEVIRPNRFPGRLELGSNPPVVNRDILGKVRQDVDGAEELTHPLREPWRCSLGDSMVDLAGDNDAGADRCLADLGNCPRGRAGWISCKVGEDVRVE